jgi:hypothetical protein
MARTTLEVLQDHFDRADRNDIEGDIATNVSPDIVLLTTYGRFEGHEGVRAAAALLLDQVKDATYTYLRVETHEDMGFLEWTASGSNADVFDGADSYLVRDGKIQTMTIHYTVVDHAPSAS